MLDRASISSVISSLLTLREERTVYAGSDVRDDKTRKLQERYEQMAWGDAACTFCSTPVDVDGTLTCKCPSKIVFPKEPAAPATAVQLYYKNGPLSHNRREAIRAFDNLSAENRKFWNDKAAADRTRFEREKRAYNDILHLEEDILTDEEAEAECECGNGLNDLRVAMHRQRSEQQWSRYRKDHHKFNESYRASEQAVGPGCFHRFMDLPSEVRDQIYTHVMNSSWGNRGLRQWQLEFESNSENPDLRFTHMQPLDTRLFATNREVYAAALDTLYSTNCFIVEISRASDIPLFISFSTDLSPPRPTSRIKRWHIRLTFTDVLHKNTILPQLVAVRDVLKQCVVLDEIRFTWISVPGYWGEIPQLVKEYDAMLKLFRDLRGVRNVVFTKDPEEDEFTKTNTWLDGWTDFRLASEEVRQSVKTSMESSPTEPVPEGSGGRTSTPEPS